jgi:hypothetical protein
MRGFLLCLLLAVGYLVYVSQTQTRVVEQPCVTRTSETCWEVVER